MNTRRRILVAAAVSALAGSRAAPGQARPRRIAFLGGGNAETDTPGLTAFHGGMAELGWVEGRDYAFEARYAESVAQRLPAIAASLIATQPDLILTTAEPPASVLVKQTKIPVVFAIARDPVGTGLARSLQRPGGTATGLVTFAPELSAKRVEILREAFPKLSHVAALHSTDDPIGPAQAREIEKAARALGLRFTSAQIAGPGDIDPAITRVAALGADGVVVASGVMTSTNRRTIVDAAARARIPAIYPFDIFTIDGGLLSYGTRRTENYRRAAAYVDKILKGAPPGDLPIEQPTQIDLIINLRTARAQGLPIAQSVVLRADRVIE
jgi:putative ABC transport system substrate-binding protein